MTKKNITAFVCTDCGQEFSKWQGRCFNCGAWETISEFRQPAKRTPNRLSTSKDPQPSGAVSLSSCKPENIKRVLTGFNEVDRVLGNGIVPGAVTLVGGDPGIGKSTILLQMMARLSEYGHAVLYASGEESAEQISLNSLRLGIGNSNMPILTETCLERTIEAIKNTKPSIVAVDSIQTIYSEELESTPGSVSQVRECASILLRYAKETKTAMFLVGHVTKEGSIAGPRVLEHMVDTVLYFEGDAHYQYRILRAEKNRFGPSGELALFSMSDRGLSEVPNTSEHFLVNRDNPQIGTAFVPVLEGSRVMVVELQALVNRSHFGLPQRVASGINPKKLSLLIAVMERYGGLSLGDHDIFINVAGGLSISEPAVDLGVAAAIISSYKNRPVRTGVAFIGELGLGGEIRPVNSMSMRIKELAGVGFQESVVPKPPKNADWLSHGNKIKLSTCQHISDIKETFF